ncbi:MAG: ribonuclease T [Gammaproteobacteria bacterium]|nr:ribonuclease T [Gammaproteobacteria bacterium]MCH9744608.1 ribonuclease T [Gammaproteobacteria bacterium]
MTEIKKIKQRFDGYLPVVIDVETTGIDCLKNGLLEVALILVAYNDAGQLQPVKSDHWHVVPFKGAIINPEALAINGIDPEHPFRFAVEEAKVLTELCSIISDALRHYDCRRAVLVGHNAHFDLNFIMAAMRRCKIKKNPFHSFTCFDTATLGGLIYGKTVLAKALKKADIDFDKNEAHSAVYDTEKTAELFCKIINLQDNK